MCIVYHYMYLLCLQNEMKRVAGLSSLNNLTHFDDISALTEGRAPQVLLWHLSPISQLSGFRYGALPARLKPVCYFPPVNCWVWTESILSDYTKLSVYWVGQYWWVFLCNGYANPISYRVYRVHLTRFYTFFYFLGWRIQEKKTWWKGKCYMHSVYVLFVLCSHCIHSFFKE